MAACVTFIPRYTFQGKSLDSKNSESSFLHAYNRPNFHKILHEYCAFDSILIGSYSF